jgi:AcrR family transcriptional regulator
MARTRNAQIHAVRRDAFVDVAARRITLDGYDALSIQGVIDEVGASKGAFYHYFGSKADLLEAIVEKMADGVELTWAEVLERPGLTARERLEGIFGATASYKNARRELSLGILEGWLSDRNAVLREKLRHMVVRRLTPAIMRILEQGIDDGEFTATDPEATAQVVVGLVVSTQDLASHLFVARQRDEVTLDHVLRVFGAYETALARILGLEPGRLSLTDPPTIRAWFA